MKMKVAQAIIEVMKENGSDTVFGIPGGQTLFVTDAMLEAKFNFVQTRHEGAAGHAADGWGRITGKPGICLATTGPGATNLVTPLGGALRDSSPVIAMVFQNNTPDIRRGDAQEADHEAIFASITKAVIPVLHPKSVVWAVREAYRIALTGRPGPVVLDFYRDVVEAGETEYEPLDAASYIVTEKTYPNPNSIQKAAEIISGSSKTCIYCGNGVKNAHASEKVLMLAEKLGAPVVTSFNGIGSVPGTHPLVFGARSRHGSKLTRGILEDADCVIVLGSSLSAVATNRWSLKMSNIVQVDIESKNIGRQYPVFCGINSDINCAAAALVEEISGRIEKNESARAKWLDDIKKRAEEWKSSVFSGAINDSLASPAAPVALMREMDLLTGEDTILVVDAGNPGAWSHLLAIKPGMQYMKPVNYGNMAFSLPAGIACGIAEPDKDVISIMGDGSLGMNLAELETAARAGVNMTILVLNDNAYGNIKQEEAFKFDETRYYGVDFTKVDYADVAKALGCGAEIITSAGELKDAMIRARGHKGPYMVEVKLNGDYTIWPEAF